MKNFKVILIIMLIFCFLSVQGNSIFANPQDKIDLNNETENQEVEVSTNVGTLLLRYIFSVIGIIILTYLVVRLFVNSQRNLNPIQGDWIQIIDQIPLGGNKGFYLVDIEGKGYVLGITEQQMNILTIIEEERLNELKEMALRRETKKIFNFSFLSPRKKKNDFNDILQGYINQTKDIYNSQTKGERKHEE